MSARSLASRLVQALAHPRTRPLLRMFDRILQVLLRPRAERICYLSIPDHTDNAYYVYRHAVLTRTDLEHVWLVDDLAVADDIRRRFEALVADRPGHGHRLRIAKRWSPAGYLGYLTSRTVFHTHGAYAFSDRAWRGRQIVAVWHGMPLKAIARLNRVTSNQHPTFASASIASSTLWRYIIAGCFALDAYDVHLTGLPRNDALRFPEARGSDAATVRGVLGVEDGQRLLLWMPTYRTSPTPRSFVDDMPDWLLGALDRVCAEHDVTVVIKLHPFDSLNDAEAPLADHPQLRVVTARKWLDSGVQLYDLVAASDGLLSDISSIIFDYLATSRPLGLLGFDRDAYDREELVPFDLVRDSERFRDLADESALAGFVRDVRDGVDDSPAPGDLAHALYEEPAEPSSELVLRQFGI